MVSGKYSLSSGHRVLKYNIYLLNIRWLNVGNSDHSQSGSCQSPTFIASDCLSKTKSAACRVLLRCRAVDKLTNSDAAGACSCKEKQDFTIWKMI